MKQDTAVIVTQAATEGAATVHTIHKQLVQIAAAEIAKLPEHLEKLTPAERVRFVLAVLPYTAPKVERVATDYARNGDGLGWL